MQKNKIDQYSKHVMCFRLRQDICNKLHTQFEKVEGSLRSLHKIICQTKQTLTFFSETVHLSDFICKDAFLKVEKNLTFSANVWQEI